MKFRKFLILFSAVFAMVAMLVSCHSRTNSPWPSKQAGAISTSAIEVTGDLNKGEKLRIEFFDDGKCKQTFVGKDNIETDCKGVDLEKTYFCIEPDGKHEPNTTIYGKRGGKIDAYCGNILELTDGADIQFKANSAAENKKCKNVGGDVICY